jgi:biofilm PGA synthesis N-glycosyltransferase PgaC
VRSACGDDRREPGAEARTGGAVRAPRLVALLPAHNEEASLPAAVESLWAQSMPPDEVVVVADGCTDDTAQVARTRGADVFVTTANPHKKAGALNQALGAILPRLEPDDLVLVMDADSLLHPGFLATARGHLDAHRDLGGVGGTFEGGPGGGLLGTFQRNEYARYARDVRRLKGKALVLTGTASVFPVHVLRHVQEARRNGRLPDRSRAMHVYDVHVLTEDNELSLALMHLGYRILAPRGCTLVTEVMATWRDLARQRLRWKRGAVENLWDYGLNRVTAPYWGRQLMGAVGVLATVLYVGSLVAGMFLGITPHPFWLAASLVFVTERVVTVRTRGWRQMLLAIPLVVEMVYDLYLQCVQAWALLQAASGSERRW